MATESVKHEMAEHVLRQGELYLQAQFQSAIASDQRAATTGAFFSTLAAAILAGTVAYWGKAGDLPILLAGLSSAAVMSVGAFLCVWAARPIDFYFPGNTADNYDDVLEKAMPDVLYGEALNYADHAAQNERLLDKNCRMISRGAQIASAAPIIAIAVWLLTASIYPSSPVEKASDGSQLPSSEDVILRSSPSHSDR